MSETPTSTVSAMWNGDKFICAIIEDGYHEVKIPGVTRIPGGRYKLKKKTDGDFFNLYSKKYGHKFIVEITGVPEFKDILIHIGNRPKDTRGCQLPNESISFDRSAHEWYGIGSEVAYKKFYNYIEPIMLAGDVYLNVAR